MALASFWRFVLLMVFLTNIIKNIETFEFTPREIKSGIIFRELSSAKVSYDSFSLIYHTNLTDYFGMRNQIKTCMENLDNTNFFPTETEPRRAYYNHLLEYMTKYEMEIDTYRASNNTNHKRSKRAFETIGNWMKSAFGLMDAESAQKIDKSINDLASESGELRKLNMATTTFVKENLIADRTNFKLLANRTNDLIHRVEEIGDSNNINIFQQEMDFMISTIWNSHQYYSNQILKHLEGAIYGKVSQLIPLESLKQDLILLENMLPEKQRLPINIHTEGTLNIFKFSTIRATLYRDKMLIEINIPKVDRESYKIYEIIPIPFKFGNIPL